MTFCGSYDDTSSKIGIFILEGIDYMMADGLGNLVKKNNVTTSEPQVYE